MANTLSFHQDRERLKISSCLFNNIAREAKTDIFPPFVFNNIARLSFIFHPREVFALAHRESINCFIYNHIDFVATLDITR